MDADRAGSERTSWIGRAKPPAPPQQPADPYWPAPDPTLYPPVVMAPRRRRTGLKVLLVVFGMVGACCAGGALVAAALSGALKGESVLGSAPPGLNTPVRDGRLEFVVTSATCGHESVGRGFIVDRPQGQFCIVSLSVANIGTEAQTFADGFQKAIGPDGTVYRADTGAGIIANESGTSAWTVINPGNEVAGKIVYDIPKEAQIAKLELHDSALSGGITVTLP